MFRRFYFWKLPLLTSDWELRHNSEGGCKSILLLTAGTVGRCSHRTLLSCKHANTRNNSGQAGKLKGTTLMNTLNSIGGWCHFVFDTFTLICIANEWIDNTNSSFALRLRSLVDSENPNYWSTTYNLFIVIPVYMVLELTLFSVPAVSAQSLHQLQS